MLLAGCATRDPPTRTPIERAIAARGGPIRSVVRWVDADVRTGAPGAWQARIVSMSSPERYALTIVTTDELHHHIFDGTSARSFIGNVLVGVEDSRAPLGTQARFEAVVMLDALARPNVPWRALDRSEAPPEVAAAIEVTPFADGARYRLGFDDHARLVWAAGPLDFSPFGRGDVDLRLEDFRDVGGIVFPFRWTYAAGGQTIVDMRVRAVCLNVLGAGGFAAPADLPDCDRP